MRHELLLSAQAISKAHNLRTLFSEVSLSIREGDRLGLIGPNGAGKSTLLKLLAGVEEPDHGAIVRAKGLRAVYVPQDDKFPSGRSAKEVVTDAALQGTDSHGHTPDVHEAEIIAGMVLQRVGFEGGMAETAAEKLSGGWKKRLSVARALGSCGGAPDLLLLDEPTNHLDMDGIRWLEALIRRIGTEGNASAVVFVTHDRAMLETIATRIVELSAAYPEGTLSAEGNYTEFLGRKQDFVSGQARAEQALANEVRKDLAWLGRRAQARRTKSKSRIIASYSRMDVLADLKERNAAAANAAARVDFSTTGRRTRKFIEAKAVSKSLGGRALFSDVDVAIGAGDCLGLLGPNGSGKTTLIRVLTGELAPDSGVVKRSDPEPRIVIFSQHRREYPAQTLLRRALSPGADQVEFRGQMMHITGWSRRFLFRDEQLEQPISSLSGGELARVHIARLMLEPADVLVLDEPTNDLDIPTLETLEEALEEFAGGLILVTHDRAMLDRLATEVLALDGEGGAAKYASVGQALEAESARRSEREAGEARATETKDTAGGGGAPSRKKLSYRDQREYDGIEQRIAEAEARVAAAEARMGEPEVIADHVKMKQVCAELSEAQGVVESLYARWAELEGKLG